MKVPNNQNIKVALFLIALLTFAITSCKKFVDIDAPVTSVNQENVFNNDASAISVLTGMYIGMAGNSSMYNNVNGISLISGLSSDELTLQSGVTSVKHKAYFQNGLSTALNVGSEYWTALYKEIYKSNAAIEALEKSVTLTPSIKNQLLGESKFLRAFNYFYLINFFGDAPLAISSDYKINSVLPRSAKADVYKQIISDLKDAQNLLSANYLDGSLQAYTATAERVRPTKWAATALLARVYLYTGDWTNAETQATQIISNTQLFGLSSLNNAFLKNSIEAIWQIQPVITGHNTEDGWIFILPSGPTSSTSINTGHPVYLSQALLNSFEPGDQRAINGNWIKSVVSGGVTYCYPFKYKSRTLNDPVTEYFMALRIGEQYLIRAEARARQNNLSNAIADLDQIRKRAGLPLITNTNPGIGQTALLDKILHERQVELFTEWGHRWFDIKRTGNVDAVMSIVTPQKATGATWQSFQQLYPLPLIDIQRNPNLIQNVGY